MHKRKLSPPRLRVFSLIVLFLLVGVLFLGLVYAGPAPSVISQPSNYTDVNGQWINEPNAWDWNNSTYADETQLRVINNIYWSGFNATDLGPINRVDLRIVITLAGLTNDYVTLKYYVGGVEGDPWTSITSSVTQQCFSLDNATEPNDGSWSWTDIGSLEIRQIGTQTKGPDPLTAYRTHEVWAVIYYGQPPVVSFTYTPEYPYTGEIVTFNASASYDPDGYIVSYEWDFGDGTNGTGEIATHIYANDGTYTVTLNVTDNHGLYDITSKGVTVLNRPPIASFTESAETVLTAEPIYFNASASYDPDGTIASYFWDFGDGSNATGVIVERAYADDGTYTVTLTVTDDDEATDTTMSTKTVLNRSPVASFTESAETVYTGETITFNASDSYDPDGTITSYFWDFGDGANATGMILTHSYADNGTYIVTLTVTDDDGATASTNASKTVLNRPPAALFTESAETVYTGENITFNATNSYDSDGYIVSYFWGFGDGTNATGVIVEHAYVDDGIYTVTLTVTDDDGATVTATATKTILNRPPVAVFTESAETVYTGDVIAFNASDSYDPDGIIANYFWDFGDSTNATGVVVSHVYADDGTYTVTLIVTDDDGATDTVTATKTALNRAPIASFTESAEIVNTGEIIYFNASNSYDPDGTIVSYFWDFGDGTNTTGVTVEHAYANDGNYTVTLTVTDDDGATASTTATKTILNRPPVTTFTESAETVNTGETITFNATDSYDPDGYIGNYFWDFGDGTNATGMVVNHAYADNGTYTVTLTVTDDDDATATSSATKTVLNRPPIAMFTESAETVVVGQVIYFNASQSYDPDGSIISYFWDFGDGTNATGVTAEHAYADNGIYVVTLTVTDNDGATASASATKTVETTPPVAIFTESAETVYTNEIITFNASASYDADGYIVSYFWTFGDGTNATGVIVEHAYAEDGVYTVTLTVTDDDGATNTATSTKTVLNRPPVAMFTESAETVLTGETIYFNASQSYDLDGWIASYFWDFGDGTNATGVVVEHTYSNNGVYTVTLTVTDDDNDTATTTAIKTVLNRPPVAIFTESAETMYTGEIIYFNASGSYDADGTIVSYFWDFGDGSNATGVTTQHAYADDGNYTVTLTVTDDDGVSSSTSATKTVLNSPPVAFFTESAETAYTSETMTFNASGSYDPDGTIVSFFWDFSDGANATGIIVNHAYVDDGVYTVILTVTDNDGASASASASKTVLNRPPVAIFTESATIVLTDEVITFNASASYDPDGTIVSYFWDFGDGVNDSGVIANHSYANDGTYTVTLTVMDNDGATASTNATKTVLNRPPVAVFTESATTVLTGEVITFNASSSYDPDGAIVSYFWNFGDGTNATSVIVSHAYTDNGTYTVTLTVTDDDGATATASSTKTVLNRPPIASFTESAETVYTGETIYFDASDSYDPDGTTVSYFWDFGDGTNATGVTVDHSYANDGNYTVTLTITDDDGATSSTSSTKIVLNTPPIAVFTESTETVYTNETITFNASQSYDPDGSIVSYFWDFGDGTNVTGTVVVHSYMDDGNYTVTLTVTDNDGASTPTSATKTILNRPPVAVFTESTETVNTGEIISFDASDSSDPDGVIVSYFWDFGDGTNATGVTIGHAYADNGTYTVTLIIKDDDGATATATSVKTVLNRPPVATFTQSATVVYTGEIIQFDASGSSDPDGVIVSYFWDFGDGTNATGVIVNHAYTDDGTYMVTLVVTDDDGATATATGSTNVLNRPPVAIFTESAETVYTNEVISFDASDSYDPDGVIVSYFWDFGDGTNASGVTVGHAYSEDGLYTVTLTVTDDDGASASTSATKTVLNSPPVASFTESAESVLIGEIIYFNASSSYDSDGSIIGYFWDFGDGTNATGVTTEHAYNGSGTYIVTLTVTDDDGGTGMASTEKTVEVNAPVAIFIESKETALTGEIIYFNASDSYDPDGTIVSYLWDFGDGANATGITADHLYADNGSYTVTLTVTDNDGATDTATSIKAIMNRAPVASFTESAENVYTGETITFNASDSYDPDGTIVSYFWDFGDGTNATSITVEHAYAENGTFTVTLTVTDNEGANSGTSSAKTVGNSPPVASFTESSETIKTGETVSFDASSSYDADGSIISYFWSFGDGTNATGETSGHAYADDGNYTVTLTVTDDDGAANSISSAKTILNRPPTAQFTQDKTMAYEGEPICFNASYSYDADGIIVEYFWDFGDGANATGVVVTHAYASCGNYTVTLAVTDDDGATGTASGITKVLNRAPVALFTESAETVYTDETITFNATESYDPDGTIISYFWDFGDGTNATGVIIEHSYADNGNYTVTLTVTDNDGGTAVATAAKTILNCSPIAIFATSETSVLTGQVIRFNASDSYDSDGVIVSYFWDFDDSTNATGVTVEHAYAYDGTYMISLTITDDDGAMGLANATIQVLNRAPVAIFTESAETVYTSETIHFNASASYDPDGSIVSYFWDFGDGANATEMIVTHVYVNDGNYTVTLMVTDDDGAINS
ncbi:PKD domain-containing protein, partial [Candidatus Bathyarchaeota archaeon]|nr:PKD domain-containing protein [Candidatus Bathyarchaeota archaeon]